MPRLIGAINFSGRCYYRVEVIGDGAAVDDSGLASGIRIFINPIFVARD